MCEAEGEKNVHGDWLLLKFTNQWVESQWVVTGVKYIYVCSFQERLPCCFYRRTFVSGGSTCRRRPTMTSSEKKSASWLWTTTGTTTTLDSVRHTHTHTGPCFGTHHESCLVTSSFFLRCGLLHGGQSGLCGRSHQESVHPFSGRRLEQHRCCCRPRHQIHHQTRWHRRGLGGQVRFAWLKTYNHIVFIHLKNAAS